MVVFDSLIIVFAFSVVVGALIFTCDDLFIDLYAFVKRIKPRILRAGDLARMKALPEKHIAVLIANWKEAEVIAPMIRGNLRGIEYSNYTFFFGSLSQRYCNMGSGKKIRRHLSSQSSRDSQLTTRSYFEGTDVE